MDFVDNVVRLFPEHVGVPAADLAILLCAVHCVPEALEMFDRVLVVAAVQRLRRRAQGGAQADLASPDLTEIMKVYEDGGK